MFFMTIKFSRKTAVGIIIAVAAVLIALVIIFSGQSADSIFNSNKLTCTEDRVAFLKDLGWEVNPKSETEQSVLIPREFTGVYLEYNKLQKQQGYDLEKYLGTEVCMFSYIVTNYESADTVIACIYTYKDTVIGGDIHSTTLNGFMHGLK